MGDTLAGTGTRSQPIASAILEVRGCFPSDSALENAIDRLRLAGFDRADINLPVNASPSESTPEHGAEDPHTEDDNQQMRTLHASLAGTAAALLAAGVVIGTGGAAAPAVAAAVAAGAAAGGVAHSVSHGSDNDLHRQREAAAARGELILAVHVPDTVKQALAEDAMRAAGATRVEAVVRT